jgi:hypothetical protein
VISHETPTICPHCGYEHELATRIGGPESDKPQEGNVSLCIRCGKASIFTSDLQLRNPTADESAQLATNKLVVQAQIYMAATVPAKGDAA